MKEEVFDDPEDINYYNGPVRYYWADEPFEVDGIVYDPAARGVVKRPMIQILTDNGY